MKEGVYHLSVKMIQRSKGRSATGAIAYRAGIDITDERTGTRFNYTRKRGVSHSEIILPDGAPTRYTDRNTLWNAIETRETKVNAAVAREVEIALPADLPRAAREKLARDFTRWLVNRFGFAADINLHDPHPRETDDDGKASKNFHAHILTSTRRLTPDGFTEKCRELDSAKTGSALVEEMRAQYAEMVNAAYAEHQVEKFVDHRSFERRGIDREPTIHIGVNTNGDRAEMNDEIKARNAVRDALTVLEKDRANMQAMLDQLQAVPAVATRAELLAEKDALHLLKQDAGKYGRAQLDYAERNSDLSSQRRSISDITPPRFARVHAMLGTDTWQRYSKRLDEANAAYKKTQAEVSQLAQVLRTYREKSQQWDREGYARLKYVESVLSRDVTVPPELVPEAVSSPFYDPDAAFAIIESVPPI